MSRLNELIEKLCPDGVEMVNLGNVCNISKGVQFNKKDMNESGSYPVINGGVNPSGYIEQYNQEAETITISQGGASAGFVNWISSKFWAGAHCYIIKPTESVQNRYLYHFVKSKEQQFQKCQYGAGIPALAKSTISNVLIPLPSPEIQTEIVRILDNFTELSAALDSELSARRRQFEYYRSSLLDFGNDVERVPLKDCCIMKKGKSLTKKNAVDGEFPVISGGKEPAFYCDQFNSDGETITVAGSGAGAGYVQYWNEKIFVCDAFSIKADCGFITKYIFYYLQNVQAEIYATQTVGGIPHVYISSIENFRIPMPSIEEQERIVKILDLFESLCNDSAKGLPAEISARQKQYEYYRDKLLTF